MGNLEMFKSLELLLFCSVLKFKMNVFKKRNYVPEPEGLSNILSVCWWDNYNIRYSGKSAKNV